ncbi:MAG: hypothetical protein JWN86_3108 [Planctomycetota bacterium]|nr:hypothetical protein [Planctomycetota bacterium]
MAIAFECPRCDRKYSVAETMAGRRIKCNACGQEQSVPAAFVPPPQPTWDERDDEAVEPEAVLPPARRPGRSMAPESPGATAPKRVKAATGRSRSGSSKRGISPLVTAPLILAIVVAAVALYRSGAIFDPGDSARAREVIGVAREMVAMWDGLASAFEGTRDEAALEATMPKVGELMRRGAELKSRSEAIGNVTVAEDRFIRKTIHKDMKRALIRVKTASVEFARAWPRTNGVDTFVAQIDAQLAALDGGPTPSSTFSPTARLSAQLDRLIAAGNRTPSKEPDLAEDPEGVEKALKALAGPDSHERGLAMEHLQKIKPDARTPEVVAALVKALIDPIPHIVHTAAETLGFWHTPESVDVLIAKLSDPSDVVRMKVIGALGKVGDPKALGPLCDRLKIDHVYLYDTFEAFGQAGEDALIARLRGTDDEEIVAACQVLAHMGGKRCLPVLKELANRPAGRVRSVAEDTILSVQFQEKLRSSRR